MSDAKPTRPADPGPRPLSVRQQQLRALMRGEPLPTGTYPAEGPPPRVVHFRDAATTRRRVRKVRNRRRPNYRVIGWSFVAAGALLLGAGTLLSHPYFAVREVVVQGNRQISTQSIRSVTTKAYGTNLFLAPTENLRAQLQKEPTLEKVAVKRELPNRLRVVVLERQPWASVQLPDGACYTIDRNVVPFRKTPKPEAGLPRVQLSPQQKAGKDGAYTVALGVRMEAPGLKEVHQCLTWATEQPEFVLDSVAIDPTGKLCLNRKGGVQVRLGTAKDLERKLSTLDLLLKKRSDLKSGNAALYVNLFACDAPAVMLRSEQDGKRGKQTAQSPSESRT
ncbi:MAG: hypothetical protein OHK0029_36330 [Armatimonadaceae bacterium]